MSDEAAPVDERGCVCILIVMPVIFAWRRAREMKRQGGWPAVNQAPNFDP
jgi:hypothetical protein